MTYVMSIGGRVEHRMEILCMLYVERDPFFSHCICTIENLFH